MLTDFRLPELGENITSGDLIKILVSVGDTIIQDQPVLELETDKATVEVPSSVHGMVRTIHVKEGEKVEVGQIILTIDDGAQGKVRPKAETKREPKEAAPTPSVAPAPAPPQPEVEGKPKTDAAPVTVAGPSPQPAITPHHPTESEKTPALAASEGPKRIAPAAPSIRRLARELGVDINKVQGSGPGGRISEADVRADARRIITSLTASPVARTLAPPLPDFSRWGEIERKAMSNVRRKTADHLSQAWNSIPHVTQFDKADITTLDELRQRFAKKAEQAGGKLTVTAIALKVAASALKVFSQFSASIDLPKNEVIYKKYCHIGVAVDTDRGLLVPVIRNVDKKNILELAAELAAAAEKARNRKLTLEDMEGGTFTITNLGGIGGTGFSPLVNSPEVAILGISRASREPVFVNGQIEPRLVLPLSLSYDHRLIDGADAARFLRWVAEALEQPFLLSLEG